MQIVNIHFNFALTRKFNFKDEIMFLFQAERERQVAEKKAAKLEKLRKFVTEGESKHEFHDPKYDQDREAATDRVHSAVEQVKTRIYLRLSFFTLQLLYLM